MSAALGALVCVLSAAALGCSDDDVELMSVEDTVTGGEATTGGSTASTGGAMASGGSEPETGGSPMTTGGSEPETGGSPMTTGGSEPETGGSTVPPTELALEIPADCPTPDVNQPPETLRCTGLFTDVAAKKLSPAVHEFTPAHRLWSDGAVKTRWVYLPPGEKIDNSDPNDWLMPIGTRLFKEFKWKGHRVETRLFEKLPNGVWVKASYRWNDDETEATRHPGGTVQVAGDDYHIPTATQCDTCHKGRKDRALGFEQLLLSLPEAEGYGLKDLYEQGRLTEKPANMTPTLGDDGTGKAAAALGYMHVNCGVCCHNDNLGSAAYNTRLDLRIPVELADGGSLADAPSIKATVNVDATVGRWSGEVRLVPGHPEQSLLYRLPSLRDPANPKDRMPPIGSVVVDTDGIKAIEDWIKSMPAN